MLVFKYFLISCILVINIFANIPSPTLKKIQSYPKSISRDFYIWNYLKTNKNITDKKALKALGLAKNINRKLFIAYIDATKNQELKNIKKCMRLKPNRWQNSTNDCIEIGFSVYKATQLQNKILIQNRFNNDKNNTIYNVLSVLSSKKPFNKLIKNKNIFFKIFNQCGGIYRTQNFNYKIPKQFINKISKSPNFYLTIKLITTNLLLKKAQSSLYDIDTTKLNYKTTFLLAINAINNNKLKIAKRYLQDARNKAYFQFDIDNTTFWQYKLTNNIRYLKRLSNSYSINIYSLYAKYRQKKTFINIIYDIKQQSTNHIFDYQNPFLWIKIMQNIKQINKQKIKKYKKIFSNINTLPHLSFMLQRYGKYKKAYFITPYYQHLATLPTQKKALIYALGRQESYFIPTSISSSYALGVMQIMPFLSKDIAKELNMTYNIFDQFNPKINLTFASHHLKYLQSKLKNPLFVAYAYNGGIGFTKRMLKTGLFTKKNRFEPYLSMELVYYDESKKYGKKVLANYFIYLNHLSHKGISFDNLIKTIKSKD